MIQMQGPNTTVYQLSVPEAKTRDEFESQEEWQSHSCVLQFTYHSADKTSDTVSEPIEMIWPIGQNTYSAN